MKNQNNPALLNDLSKYIDKEKILEALIVQLEKDTGLDYTKVTIPEDINSFIEKLKEDLKFYLNKTASQNQTKFMNLIYRVDIPQSKISKIEMDESYFDNLAGLVLNRLFQKTITKMFYK